jgi:hypothetical protein
LEFDIFKVRELTKSNEMVVTISYILAKENIFEALDISFETFQRFIKKISAGYKNVSYHNRTHGTDLAQVRLFSHHF